VVIEFDVDFTPSALERLHELSDGLPRKITHLSGLAQLAAAASDSNRVDIHTVECVFCELSLGGLMQTN
jgi:type II secretory pathway predicted ATPase ExeA